MKELLIYVQAHNEEKQIESCLRSLQKMNIPDDVVAELWVVLDRCTDKTKEVAERCGAKVLEKNFVGEHACTSSNNIAYALERIKFGDTILKVDSDIQQVPSNALSVLREFLKDDVKRVSSEIRSRSGKFWLDFLFWLREINYRIAPMGQEPRGGFCLFERQTVMDIGGFSKENPSWDTAFDLKIKEKGWKVKKVTSVCVTEQRDFTVKHIINHQLKEGEKRKQLGVGFKRTLMHSIFRGRFFVVLGYLKTKNEK